LLTSKRVSKTQGVRTGKIQFITGHVTGCERGNERSVSLTRTGFDCASSWIV